MGIKKRNIVERKLYTLHRDAEKDYMRIGKGVIKSVFRSLTPADFERAYLPISKYQGETIRQLIIENNCKSIVEFGTSFGISTIYLADAARHTGGKVISTELLKSKAKRALQNIEDAGLKDFVEVKIGDAMETLKEYSDKIDFLFLDGWKDLYLPLFQMLEPRFHSKTLIYADNMDMSGTENYAAYLLQKRKTYSSQKVDDGKAYLTKFLKNN